MQAKLVHINNTAGGTVYLRIITEYGNDHQVDLSPEQLLLLIQQGVNALSYTYTLVVRRV